MITFISYVVWSHNTRECYTLLTSIQKQVATMLLWLFIIALIEVAVVLVLKKFKLRTIGMVVLEGLVGIFSIFFQTIADEAIYFWLPKVRLCYVLTGEGQDDLERVLLTLFLVEIASWIWVYLSLCTIFLTIKKK